jgi:hypothetical protein
MAADSVRKTEMGLGTRMFIKSAVCFYNHFFRRTNLRSVPPGVSPPAGLA